MLKKIVYISKLSGEMYNYNIQFPKVEKTQSLEIHWNKFVTELSSQRKN